MEKVRIAFVSVGGLWGGGEVALLSACEAFSGDPGLETHLLSSPNKALRERISKTGITFDETSIFIQKSKVSPIEYLFSLVTGNLNFWRQIRKWNAQYVILNGASALPYTLLAKCLIRFNLTVWLHTTLTSRFQKLLLGPLSWMDQLVCVSEFVARSVPKSKQIHEVLYLGVSVPVHLPTKVPSNSFKLFSAGRITRGKGYETLIEAVSKLKGFDWSLQIAGRGWSTEDDEYVQELKEQALRLRVSERITWLGFVDPLDYLPTQNICVFPTHLPEAFGLVAVEAMAFGCVTVASDVGAISEIVQNNETGFLFKSGDADQLAATLERVMLMDKRAIGSMVEKAHRDVQSRFDVKKQTQLFKRSILKNE